MILQWIFRAAMGPPVASCSPANRRTRPIVPQHLPPMAPRPPRDSSHNNRPGAARRPRQRPASRPPAPHTRTTDWSDVADWYDQLVGSEGSEYQRQVVFPGVLKLLKLQPGEHVLDVACGQGVLCRIMHERGAIVTGIDAADPLIRIARKRSDPAITFLRGDARELTRHPQLHEASFDAITCVLAIQNIDPIAPVFAGMAKLLKPGGRCVIAMMHPAFRVPKAAFWGWDEQKQVQYRRVDHYLLPRKEPIITHPGKDPRRYTWTFHRPLQSYIKALSHAGLLVDALEEWPSHKQSEGGRAKAENLARREIPLFLALRAILS